MNTSERVRHADVDPSGAGSRGAETMPTSTGSMTAFVAIGGGTFLGLTAVLVALSLARNDGHLLYALDDAAIHQSMARQLVDNGTWGVTDGVFSSASSSPGWTILLGASFAVLPFARNTLPLLLNLLAGLWVILLFARHQRFLVVVRGRWLSVVVLVLATVALWFLPGLALVGMEHVLHAALVVQALVFLERLLDHPGDRPTTWKFLLVLCTATLVRYETAFVAVGSALALLAGTTDHLGDEVRRLRWNGPRAMRAACAALLASASPIVVLGLIGKAFGEDYLPNSVIAKTALQDRAGVLQIVKAPRDAMQMLASDPALLVLLLVAIGYLFSAWFGGPRRNVAIAIAFVVATMLHVELADFGWHERYQAYLVITGSFTALRIASEVVKPAARPALLAFAALAILVLSVQRIYLTRDTPLSTSNTYRQRYQMGLFLQEHYDGKAFLTGELGYTTYLHDGPVIDLKGLGTNEVVHARRNASGILEARVVQDLARRYDVEVALFYPATSGMEIPDGWVLAGEWYLNERIQTATEPSVQFYAPDEERAEELEANLADFADQLPSGVEHLDRGDLVERYLENVGGG